MSANDCRVKITFDYGQVFVLQSEYGLTQSSAESLAREVASKVDKSVSVEIEGSYRVEELSGELGR